MVGSSGVRHKETILGVGSSNMGRKCKVPAPPPPGQGPPPLAVALPPRPSDLTSTFTDLVGPVLRLRT